jgi:tRNA dimethylallyltransferase
VLLEPPRQELRAAIARRFDTMLAGGALAEVQALLALGLDPSLPAMRAHGVPELSAHLRGEITLEEAAQRTALATGQYAKRQATWFRHHPLGGRMCRIIAQWGGEAQFSEQRMADMLNFVRAAG